MRVGILLRSLSNIVEDGIEMPFSIICPMNLHSCLPQSSDLHPYIRVLKILYFMFLSRQHSPEIERCRDGIK